MNDVELVIFTVSLAVFVSLIFGGALGFYVRRLRIGNIARRKAILEVLRAPEGSPRSFVGFFHPYCNAGGGGELVLWTAIQHIQATEQDVVCIVYTGDLDAAKDEILAKVNMRFNIQLNPQSLHFVYLKRRKWVEGKSWPRFTLAGQSFGSMVLAWEAMSNLIPDLFIDTMGYAFSFHVVRTLGGIPVAAYVHYPTISSDMLARVASRKAWHTNTGAIASSSVLSYAKLAYYYVFAFFYAQALRKATFLMVNSTWTKNHVDAILVSTNSWLATFTGFLLDPFGKNYKIKTRTVFPPCDTTKIARQSLEGRERIILSDHPTQIRALRELLDLRPDWRDGPMKVQLVLLGSVRNDEDAGRVAALEHLVDELGLQDNVQFELNAPHVVLQSALANASVGISTMVDEHFGINIVEYMAAGLIPVVNESGGPLLDIVVPVNDEPTGFHATDAASYARALVEALSLSPEADLAMRTRARRHAVQKFSVPEFTKGWGMGGWTDWRRSIRAQKAQAKAAVEQKKGLEQKKD
ncbi:mannosyltransferase [Auriculariales sp. MPI-PUGE-AT-0066]|nr:mannosyltransferase [Auriculariales sp. MPI-PUGE-AT-0066]